MKRKLGKTTVNPLDLLLDTTSNVFGSMILIALMISLFAGTPTQTNTLAPGEITSETIERQIANAEKDASLLAADLSKLKARNGTKQGAIELARIESEITSLKQALQRAKKARQDGIAASVVDYGAAAAGATKSAAAVDQEIALRKNAIASLDQQVQQLKEKIAQAQAKVKKERAKKVQRLSLPREHDTEQGVFWVVIINNEVFPSLLFSAGGGMTPFGGIQISKKSDDAELWTPLRGRGYKMPASKNDLIEQVRRIPRDKYVACLVFPDSIQTFRDFEEIVHALGREMGWQPCDMEDELVFSTHGMKPKPQ
jgi:hypothetical protein